MQALLQKEAQLRDEFSFMLSSADDASRCVNDNSTSHYLHLKLSCSSSLIMRK